MCALPRTTSGLFTGHPSCSWLATTAWSPSLAAFRSTQVTGAAAAQSGIGLTCFTDLGGVGPRAMGRLPDAAGCDGCGEGGWDGGLCLGGGCAG